MSHFCLEHFFFSYGAEATVGVAAATVIATTTIKQSQEKICVWARGATNDEGQQSK